MTQHDSLIAQLVCDWDAEAARRKAACDAITARDGEDSPLHIAGCAWCAEPPQPAAFEYAQQQLDMRYHGHDGSSFDIMEHVYVGWLTLKSLRHKATKGEHGLAAVAFNALGNPLSVHAKLASLVIQKHKAAAAGRSSPIRPSFYPPSGPSLKGYASIGSGTRDRGASP